MNFRQHFLFTETGRQTLQRFILKHGLQLLAYGIGGLIVINALVVPLIQEWQFGSAKQPQNPLEVMDRLSLVKSIEFRFFQALSAVFFFTLGTCVGSFLNVVIYRVPLGISVLVKPSHCPGCREKIKGRDNLPLIGWLALKGRCRNCSIEISSRYPTVELVVGFAFLILYFVELISGGLNLPGRTPNLYNGVLWILFFTKWDLVGLYVFHFFLFCSLFSWAMIRRDGNRVPLKSLCSVFFLVMAPAIVQSIASVNWGSSTGAQNVGFSRFSVYTLPGLSQGYLGSTSWLSPLATCCLGLIAGLSCGAVALIWNRFRSLPAIAYGFPSWLLLGAGLGWQAVIGVLVLMIVWQLLRALLSILSKAQPTEGSTANFALLMPAAMLAHHCVWRQLFELVAGTS
ncbi:MAG: prepilin peptidase [Fuerstiella sp.]